jgi:hypothetical protein
MLKAKPPNYRFCPFCGQPLKTRTEDGKIRSYCYSCNWTYYPHVASSAAAVIVRKNKVLMVRRARAPYLNMCARWKPQKSSGRGSKLIRNTENKAETHKFTFPFLPNLVGR